ncbi:putative phage abortive infection protein [Priestia megaterium]|uniref:putative phage abortive infection protein n=1 Tax=Priestia megaterium TaxID=1404 RepID=UPI002E1F5E16|nr:putative phage abortive infection protein [Priestia megaterium]
MNTNQKKYERFLKWLMPIVCLSWIPLVVGVVLVKTNFFGWDFQDLGPFGDFLAGSTVPLFTLVSSIGVILTLRMQQQQLEAQTEETERNRRVLIEQGKTLALQRFESTFFNMINLHNEITKELSVADVNLNKRTGREIFAVLLRDFKVNLREVVKQQVVTTPHIKLLRSAYNKLFIDYETAMGHYFRNLYRIVKFVDESSITDEEKKSYIGILKAQLSSCELAMLLYNGLSEYGVKFLPLMRKYNFLDNLNHDLLSLKDKEMELYNNYSVDAKKQ